MTIAYFIASPTWRGGEQYIYNLARHMKERYEVNPFFLFPSHSDAKMIERFAEIGPCHIFAYANKLWRFLPYSGRRLARILDQYSTDIVHINSRQTYFVAAFAKHFVRHPFRLIATQHLVRQAKTGIFWEWAYRQIDILSCVSDCVCRTYLKALGNRTTFSRVQIVHNSAPIYKEDIRCPKPTPCTHILYHGRICREKGIVPLFKALSLIADLPFRITFAGNIDKRDKKLWKQLLASSSIKDNIEYIGFCTDMSDLLNTCHIGISPSIVREAGPLSIIEHMAYGLAVVTSNNGAQPEIIQNEVNGILCPSNDPQAIATALRRLLTDFELTNRIGKQSQKDFFAQHTYDTFIKDMYQLYTQ